MTTKFTESAQFKSGSEVEAFLDYFFLMKDWEITRTTPHEERVLCLGDRHYCKEGRHFHIEYKSGMQTFSTGNIFLETISVDSENKPGWVYTSRADYIYYGALLNRKILVFFPHVLRREIEALKAKFPVKPTGKGQNSTYKTWGVIVPLNYAETHLASWTWDIGDAYEQWI